MVKLLLAANGVNPNSKDNNSQTPLSWALKEGHKAVVELLLNIGADINGSKALRYAAKNSHKEVVKLLELHHKLSL